MKRRVSPGPWPITRLEALLHTIFTREEGRENPGDTKSAVDAKLKPPCGVWWTPELQQLEEAVHAALAAEDAEPGDRKSVV